MSHGVADDQLAARTTRKGATIVKTNERAGTRAQVKYVRMSAYKAREVLDLIRGLPVDEAADVLRHIDRAAAQVVAKCLASAVANAYNNDQIETDDLYVATCYADEGMTIKRWRPRARGRATRIRKRTCHITVIVGRMPAAMAERVRNRRAAAAGRGRPVGRAATEARRRRVARSRGEQQAHEHEHDHDHEVPGKPTPEMVEAAEEAAATDEAPTPPDPATEVPGEPTPETVEAAEEAAREDTAEGSASDEADSAETASGSERSEPSEDTAEGSASDEATGDTESEK